MGSEAVSTRVTTGRLGNTCLLHGSFDGTLDTQILATRDSTSHKYSDKSFVTFQSRLFGGLTDSESAVGSRQFRASDCLLPTADSLLECEIIYAQVLKFINANRLHEPKCSRLEGCHRNTIKQIKHLLVFEL